MTSTLWKERLDAVASGTARLSPEEACQLHETAPLERLREAADALRNRLHDPNVVTYLVDRNINYSNVCVTDCKFCEFYRPPGHGEAYVLDRDVLLQKVADTVAVGGTRILLQGGHHPDLPLSWYVQLLEDIKRAFPSVELNAFSPPEIAHIADVENIPTMQVLETLQAAGMSGLPGGGGEILDDRIREQVSPKKLKTEPWLRIMGEAHALGMVTSASQVIGFGETPEHRFHALAAVRGRQDESLERFGRGFLSFVMWPLQHESRFGRVFGDRLGKTLGADENEYLRHLALCRLFLDNIPHVGASWPTMGPEVAMRGLAYGADDFGSTMLEENVVSSAGSTHTCMTEPLIRKYVSRAGFRPRKRDSNYTLLGSDLD